MSEDLKDIIAKAMRWLETASEEEKEAMWKAQRESFCRGPHGPTDGMGTVIMPTVHFSKGEPATIDSHIGNGGQFDPEDTAALVERYKRWLQNTGFDGGVNSPPMLMLAMVERQAAEIARLRAGR
jgi:hypothetical protein